MIDAKIIAQSPKTNVNTLHILLFVLFQKTHRPSSFTETLFMLLTTMFLLVEHQ